MKAEIIASGTELLLGEVADANSPFIAGQLAILGIDLYHVSIVGDNYERFLDVLKQAYQRSDMVLITGGLGPTKGDITREVIAGLMDEKMEINSELRQHITDFFARLHMEMPENNLKQATLIPSATAVPNPLGSAPGWWVERNGKTIISMPGPPGEMQPMWRKEVFPRLAKMGSSVIVSLTLKTWGLSEAKVDQLVGQFMSLPNPTLALYAKSDGIQMRITAKADSREQALKLIHSRESEIRQILQDNIWGADNDNLEEIVSQIMCRKGLTVAVAESFTGGLLACTLSNAPQSHHFFKGGLVAFDDQTKAALNIRSDSEGRADTQSASQMAVLAREKFAADIGIGIDGYTETANDSVTGKAFIAISLSNVKHDLAQTYPGGAYQLVRRSVMHSLFSLRYVLLTLG
jgi:nicotinamide-nucleotide amidase